MSTNALGCCINEVELAFPFIQVIEKKISHDHQKYKEIKMVKKRKELSESPLPQAATVIHDFQFSQSLNSKEIRSVQT